MRIPPIVMIAALVAVPSLGLVEIRDLAIDGEGVATARIRCDGCGDKKPQTIISNNAIELVWDDAILSEKHQGKLEVANPHPLLSRASVFTSDKNVVKCLLVIRGSTDNLENRIQASHGGDGTTLQIAYPNGTSTALALLRKEEEAPIQNMPSGSKVVSPRLGGLQISGILAVLGLAALTSVCGAAWLKKRNKLSGSRRFLIEKVAQVPLENKASVCLLKVGTELVLVGVTSQNVTFLSSMPRLQEQYDSESTLERRAFKDAIEDEYRRLKTKPSLSA